MYNYRSRTRKLVEAAKDIKNVSAQGSSESEQDDASDSTFFISETDCSENLDELDFPISFETYDRNENSLSPFLPVTDNTHDKGEDLEVHCFETYQKTKTHSPVKTYTTGEDLDVDFPTSIETLEENETNPSVLSPVNENVPNKKPSKKPTKRRKHSCIFCDILVHNFARHLQRQHCDEIQVQEFLSLNKNDPKRSQLINKLRKEGDFCSGQIIPVQNKEATSDTGATLLKNSCKLLPRIHCRGFYARNTLRRHVKRCFFNKSKSGKPRHQSEGHTLMANYFGPNDPLRTCGILKTLRADEISLVAKNDKIICELARKYIKSHKDKHLIQVARRNMRRLARLLIEARIIENNNSLSMLSLLHPTKFKLIVQATKHISCYDNNDSAFKSPSLALQMGTLLKAAIDTAYSFEIQMNIDSSKLRIFDAMKKLIGSEWATEISTEASHNLNLNRFNKPTVIPKAEDLSKMKEYFDNLISTSMEKLQADNKNESAYRMLNEATYCSLLLFNRRRVGELQRIPLNIYVDCQNNKPSGEFEKLLSPSEIILIKRLKRIVIRGKRGRGVPVLFDTLTQEGIDMAVMHRHNFFPIHNSYLFGLSQTDTSISGYHVFRKHVSIGLGDMDKASSLTSTKLRKHLATISQILKMGQQDLEQLATFMGHTTKTHNEWYRLPSDVYQTAKVAKLLLLSQIGSIDQFKGRNLNDLNIGDELVETQNESDNEREDTENNKYKEDEDMTNNNIEHIINRDRGKENKKINKKAWTQEEKKVTTLYFKKHIKNKIPPKKEEVLNLVRQHPELLGHRNWTVIKAYVCNQYAK